MEAGDPAALENWKVWRKLSIEKYREEYERLNVYFDVYTGESEVKKEYVDRAVEKMEELGLVEDSQGAKVVDLEKYKLGKAVVRKKGAHLSYTNSRPYLSVTVDGTSIYLTRDIGGLVQRYDTYKFDKLIYVVASQQDLHVAQFFKVVQLMGYEWAQPATPHDGKGTLLHYFKLP